MTQDRKPVLAASCLLLAACALSLFAACDSTPDKRLLQNLNTQGFGNAEERNWVAIGDRIQVTDSYHPDGIVANIDMDGMVLLPEIGLVQVAGRTSSEIQALLIEKYGPYHDFLDIKVEITTGGRRFFIFGEVRSRGPRFLDDDLTIPDAVATAHPNPETADLHRVLLLRKGKQIATFDLCGGSRVQDASAWLRIGPGDILFIPAIPDPESEPEVAPNDGTPILLAVGGGRTR